MILAVWIQGIVYGVLIGIVLIIGGFFLARPIVGWIFGKFFVRIATDPYWENLFETYNIVSRISPGELVETELRSERRPPERPFGSRKIRSPWGDMFFNPVYLHRLPLQEPENVETTVVIGQSAARPLRLEIPILIGGMSYGTALSAMAKQALAMGATKVGTATNTGDGASLAQERAAAERLIVQYGRSSWGKHSELIKSANAVEIQLGQGAWGPAPSVLPAKRLLAESRLRKILGLLPGDEAVMTSSFKGVGSGKELRRLIEEVRHESGGVPIGVKIGATQWLEAELGEIMEAGADFISVDGAEGGTHGGSPALLDGMGIPTLYALVRARRFLDRHDPAHKVSLLIGGGLTGPGSFLKAMALGADAVFIGTAALLAIVHTQAKKVLPWEPPTSLLFFESKHANQFDPFAGAQSLANFLRNSTQEMRQLALIAGRGHLKNVGRADLCSIDRQLAEWLDIPWVGAVPPGD